MVVNERGECLAVDFGNGCQPGEIQNRWQNIHAADLMLNTLPRRKSVGVCHDKGDNEILLEEVSVAVLSMLAQHLAMIGGELDDRVALEAGCA